MTYRAPRIHINPHVLLLVLVGVLVAYLALPSDAHAILQAAANPEGGTGNDSTLLKIDKYAQTIVSTATWAIIPFIGLGVLYAGGLLMSGSHKAAGTFGQVAIGVIVVASANGIAA